MAATLKLRYKPLVGKTIAFTVTAGTRTVVTDPGTGPILTADLTSTGVLTIGQIAPVVAMTKAAANAYANKLASIGA
jgi:hypothetical protein